MKNRYIQIISFLIALLSFATFPACEVDDEINFGKSSTTEKDPNDKQELTPDTIGWNIPTEAITVAQAREICMALESGSNTGSKYYVMGYVKKLHNNHASYITGYGNAQFYIEDVKGANSADDFMAYQVYGPNSKKLTNPNEVAVGDFVVIYGALTNYNGTYETVGKGAAYIWKSTNPLLNMPLENSHEYVDLGLSVKWATCNVGANNPEDDGDYFAWGETEPKDVYDWSTYKWCNGSETTLTKYNTSRSYGTVDNKTTLEMSDDAARANWGGEWRMPTDEEMTELRELCTWTWTAQYGVKGYKVTSKNNGNSIFLPAAGYCLDGSLYYGSLEGCYWSSSLLSDYPGNAYALSFYLSSVDWYGRDRDYGFSVRPVLAENKSGATTPPTVTTAVVTQITETSAVVGGNVTSDGGASVTERGVVYSTKPNPVITNLNNTIRPCGSGTGEFTYTITGLQSGTTYYARAYAKNDVGTAYGEEVSFTTKVEVVDNPSSNLRAMSFSVSESKQVYFSKGNLQYHPANNEWRFAENQTDYIGNANSNCSSTYNGWLDLFGWSTSATNFGVSTSEYDDDYSGSFVDWGMNKIGNDAPNTWRTLTYDEWYYLRYTRTNADDLVGIAQVNGVNGLILLPDNWVAPDGIAFKSGYHINNGIDYYAAYQTFTAEQWSKLESAGAVFLPAAGSRGGSYVVLVQDYGYYWSATEYNSRRAYCLGFDSDGELMFNHGRFNGISVRLVKDL